MQGDVQTAPLVVHGICQLYLACVQFSLTTLAGIWIPVTFCHKEKVLKFGL